MSNGLVQAEYRLDELDRFRWEALTDLRSGRSWRGGAPIQLRVAAASGVSTRFDENTRYLLRGQESERHGPALRHSVILEEIESGLRVALWLEMIEGHAVLRQSVAIENTSPKELFLQAAMLGGARFMDERGPIRLLRVSQWNYVPTVEQFDVAERWLDPNGRAELVRSGSRGPHCAWFALRDVEDHGVIAGWEFDGRADAEIRHSREEGQLEVRIAINEIHHPLAPGDWHRLPAAFFGLFFGEWDDAGELTRRYADAAIAQPMPEPEKFPYVSFDTWGYGEDIDEATLMEAANRAAWLGAELFIVDLGWARSIGDWVEDRRKFPSGLRTLSDHVHALGMKFGLHFAFAEADAGAPVLRENPDWTSSRSFGYAGALSLCLSHEPVREWVIEQAVRLIDDYAVDWILQDGENMVKRCEKTTHTHHPLDGNYANALHLNAVVAEVQRRRPHTRWENCANGGNLMTFNMLRHYATSITNDASGAFGSRKAVYGATYPFPPYYADRYMPEGFWDTLSTRSYFFGGPWQIMNRVTEMADDELEFGRAEVALYKRLRGFFRDGRVYHLLPPEESGGFDALQSSDPASGRAVVIVSREGGSADWFALRLKGLDAGRIYRVRFENDPMVSVEPGWRLMEEGVRVQITPYGSEIVYVDPEPEPPQPADSLTAPRRRSLPRE